MSPAPLTDCPLMRLQEDLPVAILTLWNCLLLHRLQAGAVTLGTTDLAAALQGHKLHCSLY